MPSSSRFFRRRSRRLFFCRWVASEVMEKLRDFSPLTSVNVPGGRGFYHSGPFRMAISGAPSMGTVEPQVAESKTASAEPQMADGFQLVIEALKLNGLATIYG